MEKFVRIYHEYRYELLAFITGGAVMMLEVVGARLIAPYFGTSTYVWTAMIGVILASLAFGYWYGGRIADRAAGHRSLTKILTFAALLVLGTALFQETVLALVSSQYLDLRLASLVAAAVLFGPPSVAIGLVGPQLAKIRVTSLEVTGRSIGRLEAMGALGSITGTFLSGYWLLAFFGARSLALGLVVVLVASSFIFERRLWSGWRVMVAGIALLAIVLPNPLPAGVVSDTDSAYMRYRVMERQSGVRTAHFLVTDHQSSQSAAYIDDPTEMIFAYTRSFMSIAKTLAPSERILVVGGGAYTVPSALVRNYPDVTVDAVEIDPALDDLAKKYFGYQPSDRLHIIHSDGRQYLNTTKETYDVAFMDAYSSLTPPFHLMSRETAERLEERLSSKGIVISNLIFRYDNGQNDYLKAATATYRSVFRHVEVFQADPLLSLTPRQNFILAATQNADQMKKLKASMPKPPLTVASDGLILTDDYAPVERLSY